MHLLVYELYIYQSARYNDKKKSHFRYLSVRMSSYHSAAADAALSDFLSQEHRVFSYIFPMALSCLHQFNTFFSELEQ